MKIGENYVDDKGVVDLQIMIVEDEFIIALDLKDAIKNLGYSVTHIAITGQEAVAAALEKKPDLILMDIMLKGKMSGIEAADLIVRELDIPVIFVSSFSDEKSVRKARSISTYGYLVKPYTREDLKTAIEDALRRYEEKNYRGFLSPNHRNYSRH